MKFIVVISILLYGCPMLDPCMPNTTRCVAEASMAQYCSADSEWLEFMNCNDIARDGWACCRTMDGCTCLPEGDEECLP